MIKYGSNTHHVLSMLKSNRAKPKTISDIQEITTKPGYMINRAFKTLERNGLAKPVEENSPAWKITFEGTDKLRELGQHYTRALMGRDDY